MATEHPDIIHNIYQLQNYGLILTINKIRVSVNIQAKTRKVF